MDKIIMDKIIKEIKYDRKVYKLMKIGIPVNQATDIIYKNSWYTLDPRKQKREENANKI